MAKYLEPEADFSDTLFFFIEYFTIHKELLTFYK